MEKRAMYCLYTFGITPRRPSSHSPSHRPSNSTSPNPSTRCTTLVGAATRDRQQQHPSTDPNLQAAGGIRVLWVSWCDAVIAVRSDDYDYDGSHADAGRNEKKKEEGGKWRLTYSGTGLTPSQQAGLRGDDKRVLRAMQEYQREGGEAGGEERKEIVFFGGKMHHGLQGYVVSTKEDDGDEEQDVVIFDTEDEMLAKSVLETQTYHYSNNESGSGSGRIVGIEVLPDNSILVFLQQQQQQKRERQANTAILQLQDITHLREWLLSSSSSSSSGGGTTISSSQPQPSTTLPLRLHIKHTATNAATTTLLDTKHRVWTCFNSPSDTRYTACLGRQPDYDDYDDDDDDDDDSDSDSEQINPHANDYSGEQHNGVITPSVVVVASATLRLARIRYLEETRVTRVVSGGYMSGALSEQGELYIWGAACPGGGGGEIVLLRRGDDEDDEEQDEFVKVVDVRIHGAEASVYDVAIGHGHVLVAAECGGERAVFAAGDNSRGQLGMDGGDFYNAFREVVALRGKRVVQLCAAGWSSYAVTLEE